MGQKGEEKQGAERRAEQFIWIPTAGEWSKLQQMKEQAREEIRKDFSSHSSLWSKIPCNCTNNPATKNPTTLPMSQPTLGVQKTFLVVERTSQRPLTWHAKRVNSCTLISALLEGMWLGNCTHQQEPIWVGSGPEVWVGCSTSTISYQNCLWYITVCYAELFNFLQVLLLERKPHRTDTASSSFGRCWVNSWYSVLCASVNSSIWEQSPDQFLPHALVLETASGGVWAI